MNSGGQIIFQGNRFGKNRKMQEEINRGYREYYGEPARELVFVGRYIGTRNELQKITNDYVSKTGNCANTACGECAGSRQKKDGQKCIHMVVCRCNKCQPIY